jgi:hypothetical protein
MQHRLKFKLFKPLLGVSLILSSCSTQEETQSRLNRDSTTNGYSDNAELLLANNSPKRPFGYWKTADCNKLQGWAQYDNNSRATVQIEIYKGGLPGDGGIRISSLRANQIVDILPTKKNYSFSIVTPEEVKLGQSVDLYAVGINPAAPEIKVPLKRWINGSAVNQPVSIFCEKPLKPFNNQDKYNNYTLAWSDEFNSETLDVTKWEYRPNGRLVNRVATAYKKENINLSKGNLVIELKKEKGEITEFRPVKRNIVTDFSAGGIISRQRMTHGYYEARMKLPLRSGWHTSFFTKYNPLDSQPIDAGEDLEIDFMEHTSFYKQMFTNNVHYWNVGPNKTHLVSLKTTALSKVETGVQLSRSFHIWGAEVTPEMVNFYFDGQLMKSIPILRTNGRLATVNEQNIFLTSTGFLSHEVDASKNYIDAAVDIGNLGRDEEGILDEVLVDWVRFYKKN